MSTMIELKREHLSEGLRPLLVLEIDKAGGAEDITHRFLGSMLGESLFLDRRKSYAILHCSTSNMEYEWNSAYRRVLDGSKATKEIEKLRWSMFHNIFSWKSLDWWSTNIGGKSNFTVGTNSMTGWGKVFKYLPTVVLTDNPEELYAKCPWLGTPGSSFLAKVWLEKFLSTGILQNNGHKNLAEVNSEIVLKNDWYGESPPLVLPFAALTDLLVSYLPVRNQGHKNYWTIYSIRKKLSFAEILCGHFAIISLLEKCLKTRLEAGSVWRWLSNFTQFHPDQHLVENRRRGFLDKSEEYGRDMPARSLEPASPQSHMVLKAYESLLRQDSSVSAIIEPLRLKIRHLVDMVYMRDRAVNAPRKALKESLDKIAKPKVRWKGNTKLGERILRDVILEFEKEVVNSPRTYKRLLAGKEVDLFMSEERKRIPEDQRSIDFVRMSNSARMGSTASYRFCVYLCYLIKVKESSAEEVRVPPTLELPLERHEMLSHNCFLNRCEDNVAAGNLEEALSFLEELVKDYASVEKKALACGGAASNVYETPLIICTTAEEHVKPASYPVNIFGVSSPAEYIYEKLSYLKSAFPEKVSELARSMQEEMSRLNEEKGDSSVRDMYKARLLRHIADPDTWSSLI